MHSTLKNRMANRAAARKERLKRSYKQESEQAAALLKALAAQVAAIDSRFEDGGDANWGDHGDLAHINETLRGLLSGFGGE